jgi:hypothetical protein
MAGTQAGAAVPAIHSIRIATTALFTPQDSHAQIDGAPLLMSTGGIHLPELGLLLKRAQGKLFSAGFFPSMQAAYGPRVFFSGRLHGTQMLCARLHGRYLGDALGQGRLTICHACTHGHGGTPMHACKSKTAASFRLHPPGKS